MRKLFLFVSLVLVLALIFVACSDAQQPASTTAASVTTASESVTTTAVSVAPITENVPATDASTAPSLSPDIQAQIDYFNTKLIPDCGFAGECFAYLSDDGSSIFVSINLVDDAWASADAVWADASDDDKETLRSALQSVGDTFWDFASVRFSAEVCGGDWDYVQVQTNIGSADKVYGSFYRCDGLFDPINLFFFGEDNG